MREEEVWFTRRLGKERVDVDRAGRVGSLEHKQLEESNEVEEDKESKINKFSCGEQVRPIGDRAGLLCKTAGKC